MTTGYPEYNTLFVKFWTFVIPPLAKVCRLPSFRSSAVAALRFGTISYSLLGTSANPEAVYLPGKKMIRSSWGSSRERALFFLALGTIDGDRVPECFLRARVWVRRHTRAKPMERECKLRPKNVRMGRIFPVKGSSISPINQT